MVGVHTLADLRSQVAVCRGRLGDDEEDTRILTDDLPDSWTDARIMGLSATFVMMLNSHLTWDALTEFVESELLVSSTMGAPYKYRGS